MGKIYTYHTYKTLIDIGNMQSLKKARSFAKTFKINPLQNINAELYEQSLLCLPSHNKIEKSYIDKILRVIQDFYLKNEYNKKNRDRR